MSDYSKGQIYKVCDVGMHMCYIGSTVDKLYNRMAKHRNHYKKYKEGKHNYIHLFKLFDEFGVENCKIYWIENYACNSKKELEAREGHHIQINDCVNKRIEGRSKQQWTQDNIEKVREQKYILGQTEKYKTMNKEYYVNNKDEILAKYKEDRKNNPEKYKEKNKRTYYKNRETQLKPYTCVCGSTVCHSGKSRHEKTQKHQQYIQSSHQNNLQEPAIDQS